MDSKIDTQPKMIEYFNTDHFLKTAIASFFASMAYLSDINLILESLILVSTLVFAIKKFYDYQKDRKKAEK